LIQATRRMRCVMDQVESSVGCRMPVRCNQVAAVLARTSVCVAVVHPVQSPRAVAEPRQAITTLAWTRGVMRGSRGLFARMQLPEVRVGVASMSHAVSMARRSAGGTQVRRQRVTGMTKMNETACVLPARRPAGHPCPTADRCNV
jgi:hypothetical protein